MSEQNNETLIPLYEPIDNAQWAARLDVPALLSAASSDSDAADYSDIASVPTMRVSNTASSVLTESTLPSATTSTDNDVTMTTYEQPSTDRDRADGPVDVDSSEESLLASPDVSFDADEQPPTTPEMILLQISEGDDMPAWNPLVPDDFDSINSQVSDVTGGSDGQLPGAVPSSADTADDIVRDLTAAEHNTNDDNNKEELYGYPHYMGAMSDAPSDAEPLEKHDIESAPKEFKLTEHPDDVETGAQSPKANDAKAQPVPAPMYHREGSPTPSMLTICSCFLIVILIMAVLGLTFSLVQANKQNSILQSQVNGTSSSISPTAKLTFKPTAAPSPSPKPTLRPTRVPTTPAPTTPAPTVLDVYEKAQLLRDFVIEQNFSKANRFDNVDSPQSRALFFMIQDDLVDLPVPIPRSTISQETIVQWRQRYVMSLFYYALMGDDWTLKLNFVDHTLPTCSWNQNFTFPGGQVTTLGVLCDNDARVDAIRIVRNNLIGSLPAELGLLTDLTSLNWEQNTIIIGTIPSALSNLNALQQFSCLYCTLTGKIPDWIGTGWPQLNVLGLSQNTMTGSVPSSIAELTKLAILGLDDNLMTGTLDVLQTMPMLEQVYLDNNEFVGNMTATFLESATRLRTLDISGNQMMGSVPVHLMTRKYFKILDLHDNQLTIFEDAIPENSSLALLALHGNPFEGTVPRP
ncbi:hypothetical protein MHU86_1930 [Fragilaria crotonensis]|nr:hypothetical protein MHU86_1930 [Fragilaria crotonensis]